MASIPRHKTFVSYHHKRDQKYADLLRDELADDIIDQAVSDGDISDRLTTDETWRAIRDFYIADATVTVVLIGKDTWSRKYVDWEIGSSFSKTPKNSRCGVLGILLPDHPSYGKSSVDPETLPQRLIPNIEGENPYVRIYDWPRDNRLSEIRKWIDVAFQRRKGPAPNNNSKRFKNNRPVEAQDGITLKEVLPWGAAVATVAGAVYVAHKMRSQQKRYRVTDRDGLLFESTPTRYRAEYFARQRRPLTHTPPKRRKTRRQHPYLRSRRAIP